MEIYIYIIQCACFNGCVTDLDNRRGYRSAEGEMSRHSTELRHPAGLRPAGGSLPGQTMAGKSRDSE